MAYAQAGRPDLTRKLGFAAQLLLTAAISAAGLAFVVAAEERRPDVSVHALAQTPTPTASSSPSYLPTGPALPATLVVLARSPEQQQEIDGWLAGEAALRLLADEPPRAGVIVIAANDDIAQAALELGSLVMELPSAVVVVDLRGSLAH